MKDADDCAWLLRAYEKKKTQPKDKRAVGSSSKTAKKPAAAAKSEANNAQTSTAVNAAAAIRKKRSLPSSTTSTWVVKQPWDKKKRPSPSTLAAPQGPEQQQSTFDKEFQQLFASRGAASSTSLTSQPSALVSADDTKSIESLVVANAAPEPIPEQAPELKPAAAHPAKASKPASARLTGTKAVTLAKKSEPSAASEESWGFASESALSLDAFDRPEGDASKANASAASVADFARWKDEDSSRTVSSNFVKLNMRKKFKGRSGKARKLPSYLRGNPYADADTGEGGALESYGNTRNKRSDPSAQVKASGGFMNDGVDFLEECLEVLARVEAQQQAAKGETPSTQPMNATEAIPENEEVEPPRCHHSLECSKLVVKKKTNNHGRVFFCCPLGMDEGRCEFFLWEDNHTQIALRALTSLTSGVDAVTAAAAASQEHDYVPLDLSKSIESQEHALETNLRLVFGHASFRDGQQWAITRIFKQLNTLLVLPTGAGKSLCYQYPAVFLPGVTIVVSPLISLMNDQFENLPPLLKSRAVCLGSSSSSKTKYAEFVRDLLAGSLKLVFVSPEKAVSNGFQQLMGQMASRISLVCVDEAHCISEWSHHFRPSYLRLGCLLKAAKCVLAITATASNRVIQDILSQFHGDADMVLQMPWQRTNLAMQVQRVRSNEERVEQVTRFISTTKLQGGIIIYVHQQRQTEELATCLSEQLPPTWAKKIAYYHAAMDAERKEKVRTGFIRGRLRIVIATIAFGMGIDKQNVRCVVHFHMPSSIENYLQQIGRAGRDGKPATGVLYLLPEDVQTFRSLAFTNTLHRDQLDQLISLVFRPEASSFAESQDGELVAVSTVHQPGFFGNSSGGSDAVSVQLSMQSEWLEVQLDMKSAMIETFLTLLSIDRQRTAARETEETQDALSEVRLLPTAMCMCRIQVKEKQLRVLPAESIIKRIAAQLQAREKVVHGRAETEVDGYLSQVTLLFHIREMAQRLFGDERVDAQERRLLQAVRRAQMDGHIQRFTLEKPAFRLELQWKSQPTEADKLDFVSSWTERLYSKHIALETTNLNRLTSLYGALYAASVPAMDPSQLQKKSPEELSEQEASQAKVLEDKLAQYFDDAMTDPNDEVVMKQALQRLTPQVIESIERDVRSLIQSPRGLTDDNGQEDAAAASTQPEWTSYSLAKILHGITTPCFPSKRWRDHPAWRQHTATAFESIVTIADKVLQEASQ